MAKALARSIGCSVHPSSSPPTCCPPTSPGSACSTRSGGDFEFKPGAIFANVVSATRRSTRLPQDPGRPARVHGGAPGDGGRGHLPARGALHGDRHPEPDRARAPIPCPRPSGTRHAGTNIGCPTRQAEIEILETGRTTPAQRPPQPVADAPLVAEMIGVKTVHVADTLEALHRRPGVRATRGHIDHLALGASPRAALAPLCRRPGPPGRSPAATTWSPTTSRSWSPRSGPPADHTLQAQMIGRRRRRARRHRDASHPHPRPGR